MTYFLEQFRFIGSLAPIANAFAGTVWPAGVNMKTAGRIAFIVQKGVGTTGTTTITVLASDGSSPINSTAVPFYYRRVSSAGIPGAVTAATTAGFTTTAGSADMYVIEINAQALANSGYTYANLKMVEGVASAVVGNVLAMVSDLRIADDTASLL